MKYLITAISMLFGLVSFSQENTLKQSELNSIAGKSDSEPLMVIEHVPVYPGCENEKSNDLKKKCMSQKIAQLFQDNFNTEINENSDIHPGMKRIALIFKIDEEGKVIDMKARAEDTYLEAEAIRVIKLIPKMTPGIQKGVAVTVPFSLPLNEELTANKNSSLGKFPVYRGCDKESSNKELEACSKRKIMTFIQMSYDIELASRALPLEKSTQFLLEFTINKKGKIENVNAKAHHKAIAIEAIKVAKRLPKFKEPGLLDGIPVDTPFSLLMTLYF
ncbi:hypothetical protein ACU8DI_13395 [Psychroserpens sp. BH13MA-6]